MSYLNELSSSKSRKTFFVLDIILYAAVFLMSLVFIKPSGTLYSLCALMLRLAAFAVAMFFSKAHRKIDTGFEVLSKLAFSVIVAFSISSLVLLFATNGNIYVFTQFIVADLVALIVLIVIRATYAYYSQEYRKAVSNTLKKPVLIVGGGNAAETLISELEASDSDYHPVAIVDDNPEKQGVKIKGVRVDGTVDDVPQIAKDKQIHTIIIAIPSATPEQMRRVLDLCTSTSCFLQTLPSITEIIAHNGKCLDSMKDIKMEDLLGREPISVDTTKVSDMVCNKVCLVTGGGGSIGSELCRQIMSYAPSLLVIVDIYENNAYDIQQELRLKYGNLLPLKVEIASVRDFDKMDKIFDKYKPQLVFHAAAHKHVPLMEYSAEEAVKNNVFGTYNLASLAIKHKVDRFLLISTDKAVNPTNVMGASKRCCEKVIKYFSNLAKDTVFVTVRFGNVLGSNGSVVPLFEKQIQNGGPITITHPDICRYFMTIPEAVSLVLQAETMAESGQIFVLDMGEPVKIVSLAENLIKLCGMRPYKDIKIEFVGLREGEKLYEELRLDEEEIMPTYNKKIFIGSHIDIEEDFDKKLAELRKFAETNDSENVIKQLISLVPTYTPDKRIH